jgi:Cof subfamily protein (haloacid dehalogenase superfamily)
MRNHRPAVRPEAAFPIRLVALDIDGTLVGPDARLSPRIRAAIAGAVDRGVRVSLATGRRPSSAVGFANQLGLTEPIISHQGAAIRAMPRRREVVLGDVVPQRGRVGRLLYHRPMQPDVIRDAIAWCQGHGLDAHVNDLEEILAAADDPRFEDYSVYYGNDGRFVPDLAAAVDRPMTKVISSGEPPLPMQLIGEARRLFAGRASPTVSHPRFLEFVADGVSKGGAVAWLAHRAGIPLGQVMTIGDALNDLEMIADAGHGAAMVSSPVELWPSARYLAAPVEEDGAAALIEALVLAPPDEAARNAALLAEAAREHRRAVLGSDAADVSGASDLADAGDAGPAGRAGTT